MKECLSCHRQIEDLLHACPHCGGTLFVQDALRGLEAMGRQAEAAEHVNRGAQFLLSGQFAQAEQELRRAIEVNPMNATAHGNMGEVFLRQGQYEKGIPWLEKALELNPSIERVAGALAQAKEAARRKADKARIGRPRTAGMLIGALVLGTATLVAACLQPIDGVPGYQLITPEDYSIVFAFAFAFLVGALVGAILGGMLGVRLGGKSAVRR